MLGVVRRQAERSEVFSDAVGVFNGEGPPVPIPNTEVKLTGAENTWLATAREDRKTPTLLHSSVGRARGC